MCNGLCVFATRTTIAHRHLAKRCWWAAAAAAAPAPAPAPAARFFGAGNWLWQKAQTLRLQKVNTVTGETLNKFRRSSIQSEKLLISHLFILKFTSWLPFSICSFPPIFRGNSTFDLFTCPVARLTFMLLFIVVIIIMSNVECSLLFILFYVH